MNRQPKPRERNRRIFENQHDVSGEAHRLFQAVCGGDLHERAAVENFTGKDREVLEAMNGMLDAVTGPLNVLAKYTAEIANGNIPARITDQYNGDFNTLKNNLNMCSDTLNALLTEIDKMHADQAAGDIEAFVPEEKFTGVFRQIVTSANKAVRGHITDVLRILDLIGAYAEGDFRRALPDFPGKRIIATQRMNRLRDNLLGVINEMTRMVEGQQAGDIDAYVSEDKFAGAYKQIASSANNGVRLHVNNILKLLNIVTAYAEGNFSPVLEKLPGKQAVANEKMDLLRNNLERVSKEIGELTSAILIGKVTARGKADTFAGDWQKLVGGINALIEAFVKPIEMISQYLARIGKGDIPPKVVDSYAGDFNIIKDNVNACIDGLGGLVETHQVLKKMSVNDHSVPVRGSYQGIFAEVAKETNLVQERIKNVVRILGNIAVGDYRKDFEGLKSVGKRSENDTLVPSMIQTMIAVDTMVADTEMLSKAAIEGKLSTRADVSKHQGEYRNVVQGVNDTLDAVVAPVQESAMVVEKIAGGDLTARVEGNYQGEYASIKNDINSMAGRLSESMAQIGQSAQMLASSSEELSAVSQQMSANAEETATQSNVVSAAAEQVTKNMQTVATATEEMSSSIKEIAKNSNEAARVATSAVKTAETTNATVAKLGESSAEIGQVIKVITSIAQQTNLLALNATIEAARAGEAGKGFAVVANEVKELAKETAKATEDISRKIEAIQGDTKGAVEAIGQIGGIINQINDISSTIASAVEEQTATTNEIARNVQEGAKGGAQVAENIVAVAQAAKSTTQGANDTQTAAGELARMAAELQKVVAQFRYDDSSRSPAAADFRATAQQTHDAHLASRANTPPVQSARVQ